jgi:ubiquinone/menaquinone biosynthesis C-methylase UbiE
MITEKKREIGVSDELDFWKEFTSSNRFKENWCTTTPNPELNLDIEIFLSYVHSFASDEIKVLDVGSGPVSILSRLNTIYTNLVISAADPLATEYCTLSKSYTDIFDITIPQQVEAEELSNFYGNEMFDIVHIRNALDHTIDPVKSLFEMNKVLKKNGFLIIHGFENEAICENWQGMHQWNLSLENGNLIIGNRAGINSSTESLLKDSVKTVYFNKLTLENQKSWMTLILKKV